ncbi:MAG: tripartite tricarboxylate transporter substrate binding protein [Burkholderiales bacterium]|nr:tripartite tricarboxylate transporter substrate binding protein [Burkholderiales bacterium]
MSGDAKPGRGALSGWGAAGARFSLIALAAGAATADAQQAAWKPQRAVELVVPTAPGGAIDTMARLMQRIMQDGRIVETPVVIANKPGGGQAVAMTYLDQHAGDGHYALASTMSLMTGHILGRLKVNYTDYTPLAILFGEPMTLVVRPDSPLKSGRDVQQRLKADPKSLNVAIGIAVGGTNHLALAMTMSAMGIDVRQLKTVVFQANAEAMTALMGGHVDIGPMSIATALRAQSQGQLRILGITAARRGEGPLAEIPTWREQGFDVRFTNVRFMLGPKGMSAAQAAYWDGVFGRMVEHEDWKAMLQRSYLESDFVSSRESPGRLAALYQQLRGAMIQGGLVKE